MNVFLHYFATKSYHIKINLIIIVNLTNYQFNLNKKYPVLILQLVTKETFRRTTRHFRKQGFPTITGEIIPTFSIKSFYMYIFFCTRWFNGGMGESSILLSYRAEYALG